MPGELVLSHMHLVRHRQKEFFPVEVLADEPLERFRVDVELRPVPALVKDDPNPLAQAEREDLALQDDGVVVRVVFAVPNVLVGDHLEPADAAQIPQQLPIDEDGAIERLSDRRDLGHSNPSMIASNSSTLKESRSTSVLASKNLHHPSAKIIPSGPRYE